MSSKKVFIGLTDISSFIDDWAAGFKQNNLKTLKGSVDYQAPIQNSKLNFIIKKGQDKIGYFKPGRISVRLKPLWNKMVPAYYFKKSIIECNTFVFIWNSFYNDFSDYKILKEKGKKIITVFCGDDIRWNPARDQEFKSYNLITQSIPDYDYSIRYLEEKLKFLRIAEKYSDIILSQPNQSTLALRPYHNLMLPIILDDYKHNPIQREIPNIVHAPTSKAKGTEYVGPIIEKLKNEGLKFNYIRIQNMPREKAKEVYLDSDIIVNQIINSPGLGKLACEGLSMGKVVVSTMANGIYDQQIPKDCPIVDVNPGNLYDALKDLIQNHAKRAGIAAKGRPYIEKYHNPGIICKQILELLEKPAENQHPNFYPSFFHEKFIPESPETIEIYNKWTETVRDCDWYKKTVKPGERDGLKF